MDKQTRFSARLKARQAQRDRAKNAGISLPETQIGWLKAIAQKEGVTASEIVQAMIDEKREQYQEVITA